VSRVQNSRTLNGDWNSESWVWNVDRGPFRLPGATGHLGASQSTLGRVEVYFWDLSIWWRGPSNEWSSLEAAYIRGLPCVRRRCICKMSLSEPGSVALAVLRSFVPTWQGRCKEFFFAPIPEGNSSRRDEPPESLKSTECRWCWTVCLPFQ